MHFRRKMACVQHTPAMTLLSRQCGGYITSHSSTSCIKLFNVAVAAKKPAEKTHNSYVGGSSASYAADAVQIPCRHVSSVKRLTRPIRMRTKILQNISTTIHMV